MIAPTKMALTFLMAALLLPVSGCGYRLGSLANPNHRAVAVPVFRNSTVVPQLQSLVTDAVIKRFQSDGSLRVVAASDADIVVEGVITEVRREPLRFQKINQAVAREYRLTLVASVTLRETRTGRAVFENKTASGQTDFFINADLQAAESQAIPLAADDLARKVVARVAEGW